MAGRFRATRPVASAAFYEIAADAPTGSPRPVGSLRPELARHGARSGVELFLHLHAHLHAATGSRGLSSFVRTGGQARAPVTRRP
jgi:hypothetical protein